jgi:hypothetical protein
MAAAIVKPHVTGVIPETTGTSSNNLSQSRDAFTRNPTRKSLRALQGTAADIQKLSTILAMGKSYVVNHTGLGEIIIDVGETEKNSFGLNHIINQHYMGGKNETEIAVLLLNIHSALKDGKILEDIPVYNKVGNDVGIYKLEKDGIIAVVSKMRFNDSEKFLVSGYEDKNNKEAAAGAIRTGIDTYSYVPEFSGFRKQVGAVIASLNRSIP